MRKPINQSDKRAQKRPDKATEAMKVCKTIDVILTKIANLDEQYIVGDYEIQEKATKLTETKLTTALKISNG